MYGSIKNTSIIIIFYLDLITSQLPIVINTWNFKDATNRAWDVINNSSSLDAIVEGCSVCEQNQCDGTVGYGGSPDENGETTLDAMIMEGSKMNVGAVAALRNIKNAIFVARLVLENTEHSILAGDQAASFAEMMGLKKESLSTKKSKRIWRQWKKEKQCQPNFWTENVTPNPRTHCGPYRPKYEESNQCLLDNRPKKFDEHHHDTIGMIVIDKNGDIVVGTSTNGAIHKIPGRVGDSPIPGSGAYTDNKIGAATATGDGDIMLRFLPSFLAVENLRNGMSTYNAAQESIKRIKAYYPKFVGAIIVVNKYGNYSAACNGILQFPFSVRNILMNETKIETVSCL